MSNIWTAFNPLLHTHTIILYSIYLPTLNASASRHAQGFKFQITSETTSYNKICFQLPRQRQYERQKQKKYPESISTTDRVIILRRQPVFILIHIRIQYLNTQFGFIKCTYTRYKYDMYKPQTELLWQSIGCIFHTSNIISKVAYMTLTYLQFFKLVPTVRITTFLLFEQGLQHIPSANIYMDKK